MTKDSTWADRALHHARHIAGRIGPRGAATPEERQAADYVQRQLQQMGVPDVRVETFRAATSGWLPVTMIFSLAVWGVFACWSLFYLTQALVARANVTDIGSSGLPGALVATGLCLLALFFLIREVTFRDHVLRRFGSRALSQNVIGSIAPVHKMKQRVVLISQLDTPPASAVLRTPRRARFFRLVFYVGAISLLAAIMFYVLGGLNIWNLAFVFAGICGVLQSAVVLQSLRADHGEFTPGANHNASGIGTVLALAERLRGAPLQDTEVRVACCGSHTAGGGGLRDLLRQHADDLHEAWFIGFEGVGVGDRLVYLSREGWLRRSVNPAIRELVTHWITANPDQKIEARATSRNSVVAPATWRGCKSVCLSVYDHDNEIPYAYSRADTAEQLQLPSLQAAQEFGWQLLQQIDRG